MDMPAILGRVPDRADGITCGRWPRGQRPGRHGPSGPRLGRPGPGLPGHGLRQAGQARRDAAGQPGRGRGRVQRRAEQLALGGRRSPSPAARAATSGGFHPLGHRPDAERADQVDHGLDDQPRCPRSPPARLTNDESIFTSCTGIRFSRASEPHPVPKSSRLSPTPTARSAATPAAMSAPSPVSTLLAELEQQHVRGQAEGSELTRDEPGQAGVQQVAHGHVHRQLHRQPGQPPHRGLGQRRVAARSWSARASGTTARPAG